VKNFIYEITISAFHFTIYFIFNNVCSEKIIFLTNNENHSFGTRQRNNVYLAEGNLNIYQNVAYSEKCF
jgi:hypothetical protein